MNDALCGPSNALQNFQKHASVDRTLQQDKLVSRQSPSQGFRSQAHNEGILDPEFAAFESNLAGGPLPNLHHANHFTAHTPHHAAPGHAENQGWAADFQRLQISQPVHPFHQHQQPGPSAAPVSANPQLGWQNEFLKHQQQPVHTQHRPAYAQGFQPSFAPSYPMHGTAMTGFPGAQEVITSQQPPTEAFDESAFEAAFEQARADMVSQTADATQGNTEKATNETAQLDAPTIAENQETARIGSDTIPQTNKNDLQAQPNDADELAKTAGHLLDSVSHDQSQKFRESNFLALMRRIRDREVQVEGDEFRETSQSLHPGGKYYPERQRQMKQKGASVSINQDSHSYVTHDSRNFVSGIPSIPAGKEGQTVTKDGTSKDTLHADVTKGPGPRDDNSLSEGWAYGDRWA